MFEILPVTHTVRDMISARKSRDEIERKLKEPGSGFVSLRENALRLMREGITTSEEVLRVVNEED